VNAALAASQWQNRARRLPMQSSIKKGYEAGQAVAQLTGDKLNAKTGPPNLTF